MFKVLPAMHERYSYPLDILLLILGTLNKKYLIYAVVSVMLSTITYGHYLFGTEGNNAVSRNSVCIDLYKIY